MVIDIRVLPHTYTRSYTVTYFHSQTYTHTITHTYTYTHTIIWCIFIPFRRLGLHSVRHLVGHACLCLHLRAFIHPSPDPQANHLPVPDDGGVRAVRILLLPREPSHAIRGDSRRNNAVVSCVYTYTRIGAERTSKCACV